MDIRAQQTTDKWQYKTNYLHASSLTSSPRIIATSTGWIMNGSPLRLLWPLCASKASCISNNIIIVIYRHNDIRFTHNLPQLKKLNRYGKEGMYHLQSIMYSIQFIWHKIRDTWFEALAIKKINKLKYNHLND